MTVLLGDDLEEKGVRTVYEALALIPGLHLSMNDYGVKKIIVRGLGQTYCTASLKLLLNSVSMNDALNGINSSLFDIPVEQVERIEVIRGPGSVLFGENAFAGVIDVITRKETNKVFGRIGRYNTYEGGGVFSYTQPQDNFNLTLNMAGWDSDGADVSSGPDRLDGTVNQDISNAPGETNEDHQNRTVILSLDIDDFSLLGQYAKVEMGDYFGFGFTLGDPEETTVQEYRNMMLEARYEWSMGSETEARLKLGWMKFDQQWVAEIFPAGYLQLPDTILLDGLTETLEYTESHLYSEFDIVWTGWSSHKWLAGLLVEEIEVDDSLRLINGIPEELGAAAASRKHYSIFAQDEYEVTDRLTLTAGLRYDDFDDAGENLTPRLAAVYRLSDRHIVKTQYAGAFRPPTFNEIYGFGAQFAANDDIVAEIIDTFEFGYIYKGVLTEARVTLFYSKMEDLISYQYSQLEGALQYGNSAGAEMEGVELEIDRQLTKALKLDANISMVNTTVDDTGAEIPGTANWLGNAGVTYVPIADISLNLRYQYVGERYRDPNDQRDSLDSYDTVGLTASFYNLGRPGMTFRAGINNLFDQEVAYPASVFFPEDFTRAGLQWWAQLAYTF